MISIVTPWLNGLDLIPDYTHATQGAEIIAVDNASTPDVAAALRSLTPHIIRNEQNKGFAGSNNQGYAAATGDIIIFLNSDISGDPVWLSAVAAKVRDGALYGPSLGHQMVYGAWRPYIEGWCIAATRATWSKLSIAPVEASAEDSQYTGPWDAEAYPGPYWEDNDLCWRALMKGIGLVQTQWPLHHKGGQSSGVLTKWGASLEANRATFASRVKPYWEEREANVSSALR